MLVSVFFNQDLELSVGMEVFLKSHNYPSYYPPNAYVIWTFSVASGQNTNDSLFHIDFGYVNLGSGDVLRIGSGSDPHNYSTYFASFGHYYSGYPDDIFIDPVDMFVEFEADSYSQRTGFAVEIAMINVTGKT